MASLILGNTHSRLSFIYANDDSVLISFPLGSDGLTIVTFLRLSLRFRLNEDFMFIHEEVYDALPGNLIETIE